jgi:hypothetical protein
MAMVLVDQLFTHHNHTDKASLVTDRQTCRACTRCSGLELVVVQLPQTHSGHVVEWWLRGWKSIHEGETARRRAVASTMVVEVQVEEMGTPRLGKQGVVSPRFPAYPLVPDSLVPMHQAHTD